MRAILIIRVGVDVIVPVDWHYDGHVGDGLDIVVPIDRNHILIMLVLVVDVIMIMMFRLVVEYHYNCMMTRLMVDNIVLIMIMTLLTRLMVVDSIVLKYDHDQVDGGLPPAPALLQPPLPPVDQVLLHSWRALCLHHAKPLL